jgi:hypothetical protein
MSAPQEILDLIARFEQHGEAYKAGQYNETQLRRDFLDPFFKALGWDVDNAAGYAEAYRDVLHEDAVKVGGLTKAPDYGFRIGGNRKFFLEAKKPSVCIKDEIAPAYQLRRYAWNAKLPLSILSDFEEFAAYDGRVKPFKDDKAGTARVFYCTFREYAEKWDWIASIFSKDAVLKGSFDKYAETHKAKRGTAEVDADFLATIEGWRKELAQNLALRNPRLTQRELNFAVQRIIDRIIFLRICEDRGIEDYGRLQALVNGPRIYPRLCQLFEAADARYNSGLFHFKAEKGRPEAPDELTLRLDVDDKLLRDLFKDLYYPDSPYEFRILSADILGQVYEQFLGKVIRLTDGHRAVVEDKPEVKKAGGVYYTPTYIVDYIVRQTVGKLLSDIGGQPVAGGALPPHPDPLPRGEGTASADLRKSKAPDSLPALAAVPPLPKGEGRGEGKRDSRSAAAILNRVSKLRILDPACGSGSFLIGAYQHLLDWHLLFYLANDPEKWAKGKKPALVQTTKGWRLTIDERKRILLNNIYGVDIDSQAVEVTKLSLLLKVLEGETGQSLEPLFNIFHERALPDLGDNIKCGNSLIGPDFYQQAELPLLTDEERYRINVFDWQAEFPQIFCRRRGDESQTVSAGDELRETASSELDYTLPGVPLHGAYGRKKVKAAKTAPLSGLAEPNWAGGFDAVIGNPPYIRIQTMQDSQPQEVEFFSHAYKAANQGNYDIYVVFVERGLTLLNKGGKLGFILPHKFFNAEYGQPARKLLSDGNYLEHIVHFGHAQVFESATTYTCLLFLSRSPVRKCAFVQVGDLRDWAKTGKAERGELRADEFGGRVWNLHVGPTAMAMRRLSMADQRLADIARLFVGLQTDADDVFILNETGRKGAKVRCASVATEREHWFESDHLKPFLKGSLDVRRYALSGAAKFLIFPYHNTADKSALIPPDDYAKLHPLTWEYLQENKPRLAKRARGKLGSDWYGYVYKKNHLRFEQPKILAPAIAQGACFAWDAEGKYYFVGSGGGGGGGYGIVLNDGVKWSPLFLLGLLNSSLTTFFLRKTSSVFRGGYIALNRQYIEEIPLPAFSLDRAADKTAHDRMVKLVEQMLELHRQSAAARTPQNGPRSNARSPPRTRRLTASSMVSTA